MVESNEQTAFILVLSRFRMPDALGQDPVGDWWLVPDYTLPGNANNQPGPRIPHPASSHRLIESETTPVRFHGELPTQRLTGLLKGEIIPREQFSLELWMCRHVNRPVGVCMMVKGETAKDSIPITIGLHEWETHVTLQGKAGAEAQLRHKLPRYGGYKQRWIHLVASYDGHYVKLFVNGEDVASGHMHHEEIDWPESAELELAAYMKHEPHMQLANMVHAARVYDRALSLAHVQERFEQLKQLVHEGKLYPKLFHFTAGPYLNLSTLNSVNLVWETDRAYTAKVEWGKTAELGQSQTIETAARLQETSISNLESDTPYFYRITCTSDEGEKADSGLLTFKTAVEATQPFRFAVLGDTESRPHINDQLAKRIWAERPHFVINLGDLTDAGEKPHRYEWTHEYFVGMTQLTSRIPMFAVPGNGEADLVWYKHYHRYPRPEGYYTFEYGNAAFFMLDSNQREEEFAPGRVQYEWLEEQLSKCEAQWKFVCHHHATYTGEEDDYGNSWKEPQHFGDPFVRKIVPLYEKYNVDIAMFGHLHLYKRSHPIKNGQVDASGTMHLLAGGGGGNLEDFAPTPAFFSAKTYPDHHYVTMEILGDKLMMRMFGLDGAVRDWFQIDKGIRSRALRVSKLEAPTSSDQKDEPDQ